MKAPRISLQQAMRALRWLGPGFWAFALDFLLFWALVLIWNQYRLVSFTLAFLASNAFRFLAERRSIHKSAGSGDHTAPPPAETSQTRASRTASPAGSFSVAASATSGQNGSGPDSSGRNNSGRHSAGRQFLRFLAASCLAMLAGMLAFYWGQYLGLGPLLSKIFSVPFASGTSFLLIRLAVFRSPRAPDASPAKTPRKNS